MVMQHPVTRAICFVPDNWRRCALRRSGDRLRTLREPLPDIRNGSLIPTIRQDRFVTETQCHWLTLRIHCRRGVADSKGSAQTALALDGRDRNTVPPNTSLLGRAESLSATKFRMVDHQPFLLQLSSLLHAQHFFLLLLILLRRLPRGRSNFEFISGERRTVTW